LPNGDGASRLQYFLELTTQEGEFVVHHEKLIEYGVMTSKQSSDVRVKLNALATKWPPPKAVELVEDIDYRLPDVRQPVPQGRSADSAFGEGGYSTKKVYMLTPEAFKTVA
jgi:hypothetical protein